MYGPGVHARQLLIARRLLEKGVRFVQVWHGEGQPWDNHDDLEVNHRRLAEQCDQAIAALLTRPEAARHARRTRWSSGAASSAARRRWSCRRPARTPARSTAATTTTGASRCGWPAAASRAATSYGATDEFGFAAVEKKVHVHDLHATILHLLGFDHEKLTYRYAGRDFRLTDVHGNVVKELLA